MVQCYLTTFQITCTTTIFYLYMVLMDHLHICYIIYSICIERQKCILPSWPQIYKPHDVINGCYVCNIWIPIKSQNWLKCTQNSHKKPTKTPPPPPPPRMQIIKTLKCTQRHHKNAHKNTYAQLMHHYNNVTLMCRYLKSCTTRLFSRQLFHGSWRPLLVLCMWSTVYRWIPLTDGQ